MQERSKACHKQVILTDKETFRGAINILEGILPDRQTVLYSRIIDYTYKTDSTLFKNNTLYLYFTLQKRCLSNILKILPPKNENFQIKNSDIFHISVQNMDYGYSLEPPRRSGSNGNPQSMFLSRNRKNNIYPCKPQFYYIKVGFKGVKII